MTLTQSIELLENASARNFASRKALIDACNLMASQIIRALPDTSMTIARGYRQVRQSAPSNYAGMGTTYALLSPASHYAVNHNDYRHTWDTFDDAPRGVLLAFAKDIATGLMDEIAKDLDDMSQADEDAVKDLVASAL